MKKRAESKRAGTNFDRPCPVPVYTQTDVEANGFGKILLMGAQKVGKTRAVVSTAPRPVFVINGDGQDALVPAVNAGAEFASADPRTFEEYLDVCSWAAEQADKGNIRTVVVDTINQLHRRLVDDTRESLGGVDKQAWGRILTQSTRGIQYLLDAPCHLIIIGYDDVSESGSTLALQGQFGRFITAMTNEWVKFTIGLNKQKNVVRGFQVGAGDTFMHGSRSLKGADCVNTRPDVVELLGVLGIKP